MITWALADIEKDTSNAMVPNSIPSLWISAELESKPATLELHARAERLGFRKWLSWATAIDPQSGKPVVVLDGAVGTEITKSTSEEERTGIRRPYYSVEWNADISTLSRSQLERKISSGIVMPDHVTQTTEELEKLSFGYIYRCMAKLKTTPIKFAQTHHPKYVAWMQHQLDRHAKGDILTQNESFMEYALNDKLHLELAERLKSTSPDGRAIATVGEKLWEILSGEADALQLLFSGDVLSVLYRDGIGLRSASAQLGKYLNMLAHKDSALHILEIGAGTGGTTVPALEALSASSDGLVSIPRFQNYDFTDVSIGFFEKAREKFSAYANRMRFKLLDAEKDPVEQGFEAESYDVVIAANVLHATKSIEQTLKCVRQLMKPGGKLILLECTAPSKVGGPFVFGTLPGWWLGEEPGRQLGPLLDIDDWSKVLEKTGYQPFDAVLMDHPGAGPAYQATSVMISSAITKTEEPKVVLPPVSILYDEQSALQSAACTALTISLSEHGSHVIAIPVEEFENLIEEHAEKPCLSLLELGTNMLSNVTPQLFGMVKRICKLPVVLWLNEGGGGAPRNPFAEIVVGLSRAARWENLGMKFAVLSFDTFNVATPTAEAALTVLRKVLADSHAEGQYCFQDGNLEIPRILLNGAVNSAFEERHPDQSKTEIRPFKDCSDRALRLTVGSPGLLDTLYFEDDDVFDMPLQPGELEIEVKATGLSFHDVLVALGRVEDPFMGGECAGYVTRVGSEVTNFKKGDRVVTIFLGSFRSYARGNALLAKKLPDNISFTTAATTPINYATAYHALINTARMKKGESVLIHWGAGGLGQAAIQLAQMIGCEIYTTVGSIQKRDALVSAYGIPSDHIFSSRDLSFADGIKRMTNGRGVDVILNSTAGDYLKASWECIAYYGRFIEVGKYDAMTNTRLPMAPFMRNATFSFLDLCHVNIFHPEVGSDVLSKVIDLLAEGKLTEPRPVKVYDYSQIEEAYRYMQSGKHIGKIVFEAHDEDAVKVKSKSKWLSLRTDITTGYTIS